MSTKSGSAMVILQRVLFGFLFCGVLGLAYFLAHQKADRLRKDVLATDRIASDELPFLQDFTQRAVQVALSANNPVKVIFEFVLSKDGRILASRNREALLEHYSKKLLAQIPQNFSNPTKQRNENDREFDKRVRLAEAEHAQSYVEVLNRVLSLCRTEASYCPNYEEDVLEKLVDFDWWITKEARSRGTIGLRDVSDHEWQLIEIAPAKTLAITVCNYAPYEVEYGRIRKYPGRTDLFYVDQEYTFISASDCIQVSQFFSADERRERITVRKAYNTQSRTAPRSRAVMSYVAGQHGVQTYWPADVGGWSTGSDVVAFCSSQLFDGDSLMLHPQFDCNADDKFSDFGSMEFDDRGRFVFTVYDPYVCGAPASQSLSALMCEEAPAAYAELYQNNVVWKQDYWAKDYGLSSWPFWFGGATVDDDDPNSIGVELKSAPQMNPFGIPVPFEKGDIILSFEGKVIFSYGDLNAAVQEFARYRGAGKSFSALVLRGNTPFVLRGTMYFNPNHWGADCSQALENGFLGSAGLGLDVLGVCAKQTLWDQTWRNDQPFNRCYAHHWNVRFRFRQFCPDEYTSGEFAGMFVSVISLLRNGVRRVALDKAEREMGHLLQDAVTAGLIQALEEVIWSFSGAAPGRSLGDKMKDAALAGGQGFSVGVILGGATNRMKQ